VPDQRPNWLDPRFSWYLGEQPRCPVDIREPLRQDTRQMIRLAHEAGRKLTLKQISRLIALSEWPAYLAVRNRRLAVGMAWGLSRPSGTEIKFIHVAEEHRNRGIEKRLITLLGLELPECPVTFSTRLSNKYHQQIFSDWKVIHADEQLDAVTYSNQYIVRSDPDTTFRPDS
jgi:hypothetical protein